jgi:ATP-dependent Lon protease
MIAKIAIFPLPNVILFPGAFLPLHIFEPRYRMMLDYTNENDNELAITSINSKSEIETIFGWGKIVKQESLEDGRSNILLEGMGIATVVEFESTEPFIIAKIEKFPNSYTYLMTEEFQALLKQIIHSTSIYLRKMSVEDIFIEEMEKIKKHPFPVDFITSIINCDYSKKQDILCTFDPFLKANKLLNILNSLL